MTINYDGAFDYLMTLIWAPPEVLDNYQGSQSDLGYTLATMLMMGIGIGLAFREQHPLLAESLHSTINVMIGEQETLKRWADELAAAISAPTQTV